MERPIRIDTLQWFIGMYIAIRGTLMLMLPHSLNTHVFVPIQTYFLGLGAFQVLGGVMLIAAFTLFPRRTTIAIAHFIAGAALLQAVTGHFLAGTWTAVFSFSILGLGTAIAPFLVRPQYHLRPPVDLFALLMGARSAVDGVIILLPWNAQFDTPLYAAIRPFLPVYGLAYLASGLALLAVNLHPKPPRKLFQLAHVFAGGVLWAWSAGLGFPTWNSILYFGGLGTLVALLPWLAPRLRRLNPASLQTQLTVALVGLVTIPLLFIVTLVTIPQERTVLNRALSLQQTLATTLAQDVVSYVRLHRAAVSVLAQQPNLSTLPPAEQKRLLRIFDGAYPDIVSFTTYDADGNPIARSDDFPPPLPISDFSFFQTLRRTGEPTLDISIGRTIQKPFFILAFPIQAENGQFAGAVVGSIEATQMTRQLAQTSTSSDIIAYLVDDQGRVIAHPNSELVNTFSNYSQVPPVAELLNHNGAGGRIEYWDGSQWQLAGYAPVQGLGWGVVVEHPAAIVLASVNARRNQDFITLLLVATTSLVISSLIAKRLTEPLTTLAHATGKLATGDADAPLPQSKITEVAHLSAVFGAMRDRLARRTHERDRLLQQEQAARAEAEAANRIKDEFLAVLSHELRTPLNPILGWTRLLQTGKLDPQRSALALETIERNAKLQTQLIGDLLDVSRILRGKLSLNSCPVELAATLVAAKETVQLSAEAKSISLKLHLPSSDSEKSSKLQVMGDPNRLQQVFWNLLSNAVKFTPADGKVDITLEQIDSYAQIQITDTGRGISPEFLPYIFDTFRQADGSITRQFGGLGLGLAIVRHLVELHGGTVCADSPGEGQGATFWVKLPLLKRDKEKVTQDKQTQTSLSASLKGTRILVVEDEADTRELIAFVLQRQGAEVRVAASAREALIDFTRLKPDLLVSDIGMPDMDGYAFMRQVQTLITPDNSVKAIALTAYAAETDQQQAIAAGFQLHIAKPIDPEALLQAIHTLVHPNDQ